MNTDLHKRLEAIAIANYPIRYGKYTTGVSFDVNQDDREIYLEGEKKGAELGYKEAIEVAKEWLSDCIHNEERISSHPYRDDKMVAVFDFDDDKETILSSFKREMNKLWEEKK